MPSQRSAYYFTGQHAAAAAAAAASRRANILFIIFLNILNDRRQRHLSSFYWRIVLCPHYTSKLERINFLGMCKTAAAIAKSIACSSRATTSHKKYRDLFHRRWIGCATRHIVRARRAAPRRNTRPAVNWSTTGDDDSIITSSRIVSNDESHLTDTDADDDGDDCRQDADGWMGGPCSRSLLMMFIAKPLTRCAAFISSRQSTPQ